MLFKKSFIEMVTKMGNSTASTHNAESAIHIIQLKNKELSSLKVEQGDIYKTLCSSIFEDIVEGFEAINPYQDCAISSAVYRMDKCKKYLENNLVTALAIYAATLLTSLAVRHSDDDYRILKSQIMPDSFPSGCTRITSYGNDLQYFSSVVSDLAEWWSYGDTARYNHILRGAIEGNDLLGYTNITKFIKTTQDLFINQVDEDKLKRNIALMQSFLTLDGIWFFASDHYADGVMSYHMDQSHLEYYQELQQHCIEYCINDCESLLMDIKTLATIKAASDM